MFFYKTHNILQLVKATVTSITNLSGDYYKQKTSCLNLESEAKQELLIEVKRGLYLQATNELLDFYFCRPHLRVNFTQAIKNWNLIIDLDLRILNQSRYKMGNRLKSNQCIQRLSQPALC